MLKPVHLIFLVLSVFIMRPISASLNEQFESVPDLQVSLFFAAKHGRLEVVSHAIQKGVDLNAVNSLQETPLMLAASEGHLSVVQFLIQRGAAVNLVNYRNNTALMFAAFEGHLEIVKYLIQNGAKVNLASNFQKTALMLAAFNGHVEVVKYLIHNGADLNIVDNSQETSLMLATSKGHFQVVKVLIENGADLNAVNQYQQTALMIAEFFNNFEIVKELIDSGASLEQFLILKKYKRIESISVCSEWKLEDLEAEYDSILSDESDFGKIEQKLNLLWRKVESWFILGANVSTIIRIGTERTLPGKYPQVICTNGSVESFLFNYFEYCQPKHGFQPVPFYFGHKSEISLTCEEIESMFRIQFSLMRNTEFTSVNEFLIANQNVIRLAEYIHAKELLKKISELIITFNISDFDSFWLHLKSIFGVFNEEDDSWTIYPPFWTLCSELLLATLRRKDKDLFDGIKSNIANDNVELDIAEFNARDIR